MNYKDECGSSRKMNTNDMGRRRRMRLEVDTRRRRQSCVGIQSSANAGPVSLDSHSSNHLV
eukprot:9963237-Karenia_brevis.AAC.1